MKKYIYLLLLFTLFKTEIDAQNKYNLPQFYDETIQFLKQPLNWRESDWIKFGSLTAGTFLISLADQPVRDAILRDQSYNETVPELTGRHWGQGYATAAFTIGFGLHGLIENNQSSKKIAFEIVQATLFTGGITQIIKAVTGRARPYTNEGHSSFHPFAILKYDDNSFSSGEVANAFALSAVLASNTKSDLLKVIFYLPSMLTISSRVFRDSHWSSDVFFGAALGYFVGNWVTNLHPDKESTVQMSSIFPLSIQIKL
jgi:hypothetical protein